MLDYTCEIKKDIVSPDWLSKRRPVRQKPAAQKNNISIGNAKVNSLAKTSGSTLNPNFKKVGSVIVNSFKKSKAHGWIPTLTLVGSVSSSMRSTKRKRREKFAYTSNVLSISQYSNYVKKGYSPSNEGMNKRQRSLKSQNKKTERTVKTQEDFLWQI